MNSTCTDLFVLLIAHDSIRASYADYIVETDYVVKQIMKQTIYHATVEFLMICDEHKLYPYNCKAFDWETILSCLFIK